MKKIVITCCIVLLLCLWKLPAVKAPTMVSLYAERGVIINPYEDIWQAVCMEESNMDPNAYNPLEEATGISQIRPIRLEEYNKLTGKNYTMKDMFNPLISKEIFMFYASSYGSYYSKVEWIWS
jgi:hypothetical protein